MKNDPLNQFINLRKSLLNEKAAHLARLTEIDKALGTQTESAKPAVPTPSLAKAPAQAARKPVRPKKSGRIPGQPSLKEAVRRLTAAKPLTRAEIIAGLKKAGQKYAEGSLQFTLYKKGNFKRADGKFSPAN